MKDSADERARCAAHFVITTASIERHCSRRDDLFFARTSNSDLTFAQQCARLASDDKYQEYREVLIQMAAHLMRLGWLEAEMAEEVSREANTGAH